MVNTLNGLEKAIAEMKLQSQKMTDHVEALSSTLDDFIWEIRASFASPLLTLPKFDGSGALVWLARANQYFLIKKTPSDRRVGVAIDAMSGPATPWLKLLLMRYPSLSSDKFTQELLRRFGDDAIAVRVAKNHPKIPPNSAKQTSADLHAAASSAVVSSPFPLAAMASMNPHDELSFVAMQPAPPPPPSPSHLQAVPLLVVPPTVVEPTSLLHSSPPPQPPPIQQTCKPFILSRPMPLPVLETTPLLPLSHDIPSLQPPSIPLPEQKLIPAAATFQPTPTVSLAESIHALLDVQSLNGSQSYERGMRITTSKLTPVALACPVRNIFVCTLTSVCKHEYDPPPPPPPTMYCVFGFQTQPCGQGCFKSEAIDTEQRSDILSLVRI